MSNKKRLEKAKQFNEDLCHMEETCGEHAAFSIVCEQHGIDEDEGYELLALLAEEE